MIDLKHILKNYKNYEISPTLLKYELKKAYPNAEKQTINIINIFLDWGIQTFLKGKTKIGEGQINYFLMQIEDAYGVSPDFAREALFIWLNAYDIKTISSETNPTDISEKDNPSISEQSNFEVTKKSDGYYISCMNGFEEDIMTIPSTINGVKIIGIAGDAFKGCGKIKRLELSEGIEIIEDKAFQGCKSLESIHLPNTLRKIGNNTLDIDNSVGAFSYTKIKEIVIPDNVTFLGRDTFRNCSQLEEIYIPDNLREIDACTFMNCRKLKRVNLPKSLMEISSGAFSYCENLENVILPDKLLLIGERAFHGTRIKEIKIPYGTEVIGYQAFDSTPLTAIHIPPTVIEIGTTFRSTPNAAFGKDTKRLTIYCEAGSYAMKYAREHGINCEKAEF